ncbi:MAG: tetratricopeptide repeat protein [Terriglobia bacterium]
MNRKNQNRKKAEDLEALGWEALEFPGPTLSSGMHSAEDYFRQALAHDPDLADAYNGLGTVFYSSHRLAEAEAMFRTAFEKARAELGTDKPQAFTWWGEISTRPYMRARHNLGLVYWRQGKYPEAIHEFAELLRRNPYDNQGIRYLIGGMYHLSGNLSKATSYYKKAGAGRFGERDPETEFNYGLVLFQTNKHTEAILQFRVSFFLNLYLPQIVLFRTVNPHSIWHGSNLAEPQYALDYGENYSKLWARRQDAATFLGLVYNDETVQSEIRRFVELRAKLLVEKDVLARGPVVDEGLRLQSHDRLEATNPAIASSVLPRFRQ